MRNSILAMALALSAPPIVAAQGPLDLIAQDTMAGIAIRDLNDLIRKGDELIRGAEIRVPLRPSQVFDMGIAWLGVQRGLDRAAPAAILWLRQDKEKEFAPDQFVPVVPFVDADTMAETLGLPRGKLVPATVLRTARAAEDSALLTRYVLRQDKHVYLCGSEARLQRILAGKSVASTLSPAQRQIFKDSDVLLYAGRQLWRRDDTFIQLGVPTADLGLGEDPRERELAKQLAASLRQVEHGIFGVRIHEGLDLNVLATVPPAGDAARFFKSLRTPERGSTLQGLPEGDLILAHAAVRPAEAQGLLTRAVVSFLFDQMLVQRKLVHDLDAFTYLGVFQEVWSRLQGQRLAVYQNSDESRHGLFSAVAILDVEDGAAFLGDMKKLMKMAQADSLDFAREETKREIDIAALVRDLSSPVYAVRQGAHTKLALIGEPALPYLAKAIDAPMSDLETKRRAGALRNQIGALAAARRRELLDAKNQPLFIRPKLTFVTGAEKRQGWTVDAIRVELPGMEKTGTKRYVQMLGPDWDKIRLAVTGKQIVVLLGSNVVLFESALRNIATNEPGLAAAKQLAAFYQRSARDRLFELHASAESVLRLVDARAKLDAAPQLTSMALTIGEDFLRVDGRMPLREVRAIARKAQPGAP